MTIDVEIRKHSGEKFTLGQFGVAVQDFLVSSIPVTGNYGRVEGSDRNIDNGATFGSRIINVPFSLRAKDMMDFPLLRDELFGLLVDKQSFYIREKRRVTRNLYDFEKPGEKTTLDLHSNVQFVGGKQYLVRIQNTFDLDQIEEFGKGVLTFETTELPFAESIGTTQDIQRDGINSDKELWGFGMGLIADDESLRYTHAQTSFRIYNAGNVPIHPFEQELKITISNVQGSTSFFELRNSTTGSVFRVNEAVTPSQKIVLNGPNITINNLQALRKTNRQFVELAKLWNNFVIIGATSAKVEFDFRFYYL